MDQMTSIREENWVECHLAMETVLYLRRLVVATVG